MSLQELATDPGFIRPYNQQHLKESATSCPLCEVICEILSVTALCEGILLDEMARIVIRAGYSGADSLEESPIRFLILGLSKGCNKDCHGVVDGALDPEFANCQGRCGVAARHVMPIMTLEDTDAYHPSIQLGGPVTLDPMSDRSISIIQKWLKRCETSHPSCRVLTTRGPQDGGQSFLPVLPTRVIRVDSADEKKVSLYQTFGQFGRYTALSHRWVPGKMPKWVTTKKNIDKRQKGFSIRKLPKSIRDAIQVTRKIGLKYLWIDSLCILQDSAEDWDIESSRMVDVYSNAHVTLFADGARDDDAGFLGPRNFTDHKHLAVRLKVQQGGALSLPVFIRISVYGGRENFESTVDESVLSSRGWILQERLMSRRILHFGKEQICWECRTMVDQEDGLSLPKKRKWLRGIHKELLDQNAPTDSKNWRRITEVYSKCQLTKHCDKLPALSGIASAVSAVRKGDIYLAGLWKNSLALDLAWKREWTNSSAPTEYRAPSWSWASIDGRITYWNTSRLEKSENVAGAFDVTEARVEYQGKNLFGHVRDGSLTLSGLLVEVSCLGPYSEWQTPLYVGGTPVGNAYFDLAASSTLLRPLGVLNFWILVQCGKKSS